MIKARSKGGSVHNIVGRVKNRETVPFASREEGIKFLQHLGWEIL